jgi:hypothetical protein
MQKRSKAVLTIIVFAAIALVFINILAAPALPDSVQIENQISVAIAAANDKNAAGVMSIISPSYTDAGANNLQSMRFLLQRAMTSSTALSVTSATPTITIVGDRAQSSCNVDVVMDGQTVFNQVLDLIWRKETTHRYLIIPAETWRVVQSSYSGTFEDN